MIVVAVASGTSVDALDVAAVQIDWAPPASGEIEVRVLAATERAWPAGLRERLLAVLPPAATTAAELCALDTLVGQAVADAAAHAVAELAPHADLVVSPGQTVHHEVVGTRCLATLQLGQPAWVAERTGLPVVSDLRARDVAAGGHGAPLASALDVLWLADAAPAAALNLGGIANVTVVPGGGRAALAWDTGPASCLLDVAASRVSGAGYDDGGRLAMAGTVRADLLDALLAEPYYAHQPPKSTGRELFSAAHLDAALSGVGPVSGPDLLATLTELTAATVAAALAPYEVREVVASGGGTRNEALMAALRRRLGPAVLTTSEEHGLPADAKEAVMWALLGFLTWHGVETPAVTGAAGRRILGRISPGASPLRLPAPAAVAPRRLRVLAPSPAHAAAEVRA